MTVQYIIVILIVVSAFVYAGTMLWKKSRSFSTKSKCGTDCGCNVGKEKLTSTKV